jgi:hypothetical protein
MTYTSQPTEGLRIDFPATLEGAREAVCEIIGWLESHHHDRDECVTWELMLDRGHDERRHSQRQPANASIEASCSATSHSDPSHRSQQGFEWPEEVCLPEDDENEHGRGLFIIQSLTDHCRYLRGRGTNVLDLQRQRKTAPPPTEDLAATLDLMTAEVSSCYETLANIFRLCAEAARDVSSEELASNWLRQLLEISGADFLALRMLTPDATQLEDIANVARLSKAENEASRPPIKAQRVEGSQETLDSPLEPERSGDRQPQAALRVSGANQSQAATHAFSTSFIDLNRADLIESRAVTSRQDQWFDGNSVFHQDDPLSRIGAPPSAAWHTRLKLVAR